MQNIYIYIYRERERERDKIISDVYLFVLLKYK